MEAATGAYDIQTLDECEYVLDEHHLNDESVSNGAFRKDDDAPMGDDQTAVSISPGDDDGAADGQPVAATAAAVLAETNASRAKRTTFPKPAGTEAATAADGCAAAIGQTAGCRFCLCADWCVTKWKL